MGRPLSVCCLCLLSVSVGHVCCLYLLSALVAAVPFYLSAAPVVCACWLCLLAMSVVCACWPRSWRRYLSIFRPRLLAVPVGHVCCLCLLSALVAAVPRVPPARRYPGFRRRGGTPASTSAAVPRLPPARRSLGWHIEAPRGQILLRVPQTRRPPDHTPTHRAGRSSGSAVPNLIEQGCDAHHDMRTPAPPGHPALFGCASVCPCFALRHQLRRRQRFTPKSSGRNSQRGSTAAPGSHAQ